MAVKKEGYVTYTPFKDNDKYKDDFVITINGIRFPIKRGVANEVPQYVVDAIEDNNRQIASAADHSDHLERAYKQTSKVFE